MNKKRNGFTLVELLAVIVILAIVLIIAVPGVLSIINKTKDNAYDRQVDMIKNAAKNYVTANSVTWEGDNPKSTLVTLDMLQSGGAWDTVAGVMKASNGTDLLVLQSGFDQAELNQLGRDGKYLDVYDYGTTWQDWSRGHLGDATLEMGPFNSHAGSWYDDYGAFVSDPNSWFVRGTNWGHAEAAGLLSFSCTNGQTNSSWSSRIVTL